MTTVRKNHIETAAQTGAHNPFGQVAAMPRSAQLSAVTTEDQTPPAMKSARVAMPQRANHKKPPLDIMALPVDTDVPWQKRQIEAGDSKWAPLFDVKLAKVGNSLVVPATYHGGIAAAALKRSRQKKPGVFKVAQAGVAQGLDHIPDGTPISRVWRVA